MKIRDVIEKMEQMAPPYLQESYDNIGLQLGRADADLKGILVTLDITEHVIDEAIEKGMNMIIAHHPLIFNPLNRVTEASSVGRCVIKSIKNDISIYVMHTNLDNSGKGINIVLAEKLGVVQPAILQTGVGKLNKIVTFCPVDFKDKISEAMFKAGAGRIGNYDMCSFQNTGNGTFRALEGSSPYVGTSDQLHIESEVRLEMVVPFNLTSMVIEAMKSTHPYEEVAYDVIPLANADPRVGIGAYGDLNEPVSSDIFLQELKSKLGLKQVRHNMLNSSKIRRIGVCGGSGAFLIEASLSKRLDALVTSEIKYHQFLDTQGKLLLIDAGHYETEIIMTKMIYEEIRKKFPNFACCITKHDTNPVKYS